MNTIMEDNWTNESLAKLRKAVSLRIKSKRTNADIEDITEQVLLICLTKGYKPSSRLITNVIIDWRRHQKVVANAQYTYLRTRDKEHFNVEHVHELLRQTKLTPPEQTAIWQAYWNDRRGTSPELKSALLKLFIQARKHG